MALMTEKKQKHRNMLEETKKHIGELSVEIRKIRETIEDKNERTGEYDLYKTISIVFNYLEICNLYMRVNTSSLENLGRKSESDLREARNYYSNAIRELDTATGNINDFLSDKDEFIKKLEKFNPARLLVLMRYMQDNINLLYEGFKKSRWWGNVVSLEGEGLSSLLFFINFKDIANPSYLKAFYDQKIQIKIRLIEWLKKVSNNFREKYMLQTMETSDADIRLAISYQEKLKRICLILNEREEIDLARKTIEIWEKHKEKDNEHREKKAKR